MIKEITFGLIGGLGLFIYGIHLMGEGLQKAAGDRMRKILSSLTNKPILGVFVGAGITALIQSSSATSVMLVGFVNAGLMSLTQAIGVIMGANIGTTITGQLIAFKLTNAALPAIGIGFALSFFSKDIRYKNAGEVILGFGILFLGLKIMTDSVAFLKNHESIAHIFIFVGNNKKNPVLGPILGVFAGMAVTMIIQSSSATIGLLMALATGQLITINAAIPILLGDNIGTCITALIASIGTSLSAKRTALSHALFNIIGTIIALILLSPYTKLIVFLSKGNTVRQIANAHTLFNIMNTIILLPFISCFVKVVSFIIPGRETDSLLKNFYLDRRLIKTPVIALEQVKREISRMARIAEEMIRDSIEAFFENDKGKLQGIHKKEGLVDLLQKEITDYLVELSQESITPEVSKKINSLMRMTNNIERIGDHGENLAKLTNRKLAGHLCLPNEALQDLKTMYDETSHFYNSIITSIEKDDQVLANTSLRIEKTINRLNEELRIKNINRLNKGICDVISGLIFMDVITNFEKIGDHSFNIGEAVLGIK